MHHEVLLDIYFSDILPLKIPEFGNFGLLFLTIDKITGTEKSQTIFDRIRRDNIEGLHSANRPNLTGGSDKGNALQTFLDQRVKLSELGIGHVMVAIPLHPVGCVKGKTRGLTNIRFLGPVPASEVPTYLSAADIASSGGCPAHSTNWNAG